MTSYRKALVAIDLNSEAKDILNKAKQLQDQGTEIHLAHILEHPITGYGEATGTNHSVTEAQLKQDAYPRLTALAKTLMLESNALHITFGSAAEQIHQLAERLGSDLIICGSHGTHGLKLLLGSTANSLVHGAKCDILTVRLSG